MARTVEVFTAGCGVCNEVVQLVQRIACSACDVQVLDMNNPDVLSRAQQLGVQRVPAIAINGALASCCVGGGYDEATLRAAGLGVPDRV